MIMNEDLNKNVLSPTKIEAGEGTIAQSMVFEDDHETIQDKN